MNKRFMLIVVLLLVVPMLLTACGGGVDEGDLEDAVEKAFEDGDIGDLNDLTCDDDQMPQEAADAISGEDANWNVDCSVEDDSFECTLTVEGEEGELVFRGDVEDDKICNPTAEIDGQEVPIGGGS